MPALFVGTTKCSSLVRSNPEDAITNCTFHQVIKRLSLVEFAFSRTLSVACTIEICFCVWNERFLLKQEQWWSIKTQKQNFLMRFDLTYFFIPSGFVHLHGFGASVKLSILRLNLIMEDTFLVV